MSTLKLLSLDIYILSEWFPCILVSAVFHVVKILIQQLFYYDSYFIKMALENIRNKSSVTTKFLAICRVVVRNLKNVSFSEIVER